MAHGVDKLCKLVNILSVSVHRRMSKGVGGLQPPRLGQIRSKNWTFLQQWIEFNVKKVMVKILQGSVVT